MDDLNFKIVSILKRQGLQTIKAIAGLTNVSERTVRRHVDDLIKQDIIKIVAIPNPVLCGLKAWSKIGIKVDPAFLARAARTLVNHPAVYFVAYSLGRFDIIIAVHFETIDQLTYFVNSELPGIKGIMNSETWLIAYPRKYYGFSWPAPLTAKNETLHGFSYQSVAAEADSAIDKTDRNILAILGQDGSARPAAIKARLGLGESTIRKRIQYMMNNNIFRKEVVLSSQMLENETWATMGILTNGRDAHRVIDSLVKLPAIYLASVSLGKFNIVTAGHFANIDLLNRFVTEELPGIEGISSTETFVHNRPLKYHNIALV